MVPYIFVAAAVLAVIPILILYKIHSSKLKEDPSLRDKVQTKFMIGIAISEAIPILLIVYGFIKLEPVQTISALFIPFLIVLFLMAYAAFFILVNKRIDVTPESEETVNAFAMVSLPLSMSMPLIALVSLFLMMP
ncbi:hypothetical protein BME96_16565 [Virgibacillus halodenitrificans]|uniref:Uncharacterized protein n=1 Tax=Virgibacillus halodenitrificans TaxID=1482 RepID=A0AAC9J175_VIRHA|nr:hypothetical protein [Virgibacillus halodenitrificans]APC49701.1 hypothetical protein BME96_16565 [Virgibacillus halodenitrificans]MYL58538.1 hypothetical protein [Virgibacillus halodenitrificans]CDQ31497.1 hypothetical protein BN993_00877 [Virgibacillus halodenitrificans]